MAKSINDLLESGALAGVVQEVLTGRDDDAIKRGLRAVYPDVYASALTAIIQRARSVLAAGKSLQLGDDEDTGSLGGIPVNPGRRGRLYAGSGRFQYRVTVYLSDRSGDEQPVTVFVTSDTRLSRSQIMAEARKLSLNRQVQATWLALSYRGFKAATTEPEIIGAERLY